jgi:outer membrane usher protein
MRHKDGSPYNQYSSPIYEVTFDTDGKEILTQNSELYLFTDQEGRYIISSIPEGDYSFDVQIDDTTWYAVRFTVPHMEDKKLRVLELSDYNDAGPYDEYNFEGYEHTLVLHTDTLESEEDFWNRIFPPVE